MKKIIKKKNIRLKSVNNHKIKIYHKKDSLNHIVSKGLEDVYASLDPIYQQLENDFLNELLFDCLLFAKIK